MVLGDARLQTAQEVTAPILTKNRYFAAIYGGMSAIGHRRSANPVQLHCSTKVKQLSYHAGMAYTAMDESTIRSRGRRSPTRLRTVNVDGTRPGIRASGIWRIQPIQSEEHSQT